MKKPIDDNQLTPEQGKELLEIYKKAGWSHDDYVPCCDGIHPDLESREMVNESIKDAIEKTHQED